MAARTPERCSAGHNGAFRGGAKRENPCKIRLGEVAELLNAAALKCLQLTSISPRKGSFEHAKPTNRSLSRPLVSYSVRKSVRRIVFLTGGV